MTDHTLIRNRAARVRARTCEPATDHEAYELARNTQTLLAENERLSTELAAVKAKLRQVEMVKCWTNEDGKRFVFVTDLQDALGVPRDDREANRG